VSDANTSRSAAVWNANRPKTAPRGNEPKPAARNVSSRGPDVSVVTSFVSTDRVTAGRERPRDPSPPLWSRPRPRTRGSTYRSTASRSTSTWRSTRRLRLRARPFAPPGTVSGTTSAEKLKRKCAPTPSAALRQNLSRTKTRSGALALASPSLASSVTDRASPKSRRIAPATRFASARIARVAGSSAAEKENASPKSRVGVSAPTAAARRSASAQASRSRRPPLGAASTSLPPPNTRSNSPPPPAFQRGARETTRASASDAAK